MMVKSVKSTLFLGLSLVCLVTVQLVDSQRIPTSISDAQQQATDLLNKLPKPSSLPGGQNLPNLSNLIPNGLPNLPSMPSLPNMPGGLPNIQAPATPTIDLPNLNGLLSMLNGLPGQLQQLVNGLLTSLSKMLPSLGSGGQMGRRR